MLDEGLVTDYQRRERERNGQQADARQAAGYRSQARTSSRYLLFEEDGMLLVRTVITVLCAIGFYASVFMLRKSVRAARGELAEPSVVQTPRARLFFGT